MNKFLPALTLLAALAGSLPQTAAASQVVMNFEGLADNTVVGSFYNNSDARDVNVTFTGALALRPGTSGGTGNFSGRPAGDDTVVTNPGTTIEFVATDLFDRLDFLYSADQSPFSVTVFDQGNNPFVIGGTQFAATDSTCGQFCSWAQGSIDLANFKGERVVFEGSANLYLLDDLTLTTRGNGGGGGGGNVPEPTSLALVALALAGVGAATRRRPSA